MKRKITTSFLVLVLSAISVRACDICGCGVGSYYLGILPEFNKRFIGLRYQHKILQTHLGPDGERTPLTADETYQSSELWGGLNMGTKYRVLAFVPYNFNKLESQGGNGKKNGLGDIAVMVYIKSFENKGMPGSKLLIQSLWIGAGIKVPTGRYEAAERLVISESPNNFQLGTASTDFTLNAAYDIRYHDMGLDINLNYKLNTENKFDYRYGNKFSSNMLAYHKFRIAGVLTASPNAGILYETASKDVESGKYQVDVSGGYSLSAIGGFEISAKSLSMGANYQNVRSQYLAGGRAHAGNRIMLHFSLPL